MFDINVIIIIIQLILLEGILSIDNAAVLGAMAAPLPNEKPVPWPDWLRSVGKVLDPLLGGQQDAALKVGLLGAYFGRAAMLFVATIIIENPWLRIVGAAYLVYLAVEHIANMGGHTSEEGHGGGTGEPRTTNFWSTVLAIELADLAFSLDNVVAAVALSDRFWVVAVGVGIGIVTMRFAAGIFARLIEWEPALQTGAYLLVLAIGFELLLEEFFHVHLGEVAQFLVSVSILALTIGIARSPLRHLNVLWQPLIALFRLIHLPFAAIGQLFRSLLPKQNAA
jgi:tellurite resistance protein TerC